VKDEAIRIRITTELLANFLEKGERHINVIEGITKEHKLVGVIQSYVDSCYYLMFVRGNPPEGTAFRDFIPTFETIKTP